MMNQATPYKLSFTALSLALSESVQLTKLYLEIGDWDEVRIKSHEENLLQTRTKRSAIRVTSEIIQRLSLLNNDQLDFLVSGSVNQQRKFMWFVMCSRYRYIKEFAVSVLHQKFLKMDFELTENDYHAFVLRQMDWHPELEELTESTQTKLRTVLFRMMRESEIITYNNRILRYVPDLGILSILKQSPGFTHEIFPAYPSDFEV